MTKMAPMVSVDHHDQPDAKPGIRNRARDALDEQREGVRLGERDHHREVAGPLGQLLPALLVLLHLADGRDDAAAQLEDDRGRDVRHDAEREDRRARQAAAEGVVQREERRVPVPAEFWMKSDSACTFTAGAAMCAPTR